MSRILITGGSGFIGTHLCRALTADGHEVRVLDLKEPALARDRIERVHYEKGDIRDRKILDRMVDGIDAVYHFAAIVSVPVCQKNPVESYDINQVGTCHVADSAIDEGLKRGKEPPRLIFASSAAVYGHLGQAGVPIGEEKTSDWPLSFYGAQKLGSEQALRLYQEARGLPVVVFRFFNVFGVGQDPSSPYSGVITVFSKLLKEGRPLQLNDAGMPTRDFISVHDIVSANVRALKIDRKACDGRAINLGTSKAVSIRELAAILKNVSGRPVDLVDAPAREGDVQHSLASIDRAKRVLDWHPRHDLQMGLAELLKS